MRKRPLSITVIGWFFVAAGLIGLAYHATELDAERLFGSDFLWVCFVRLLAIVCGVFMLRGDNWVRWGLVVWVGYHVLLSILHTPLELAVHGLLLAVMLFLSSSPAYVGVFSQHIADSKAKRPCRNGRTIASGRVAGAMSG